MQQFRLRFGVLGTARIADAVVRGIRMSSNAELRAIASRDLGRAKAWASERDVPFAFGSYDEMLASDQIDAVYVPLPNALHKKWSVRAAQNGKHVLCEKPIAANAAEVEEMIAAAEANGVKMMEAFMYRYHPQIARLQELLANGAIGEVKIVRASFGFFLNHPDDVRWSKELAGGALLDLGCYCVNVARLVVGAEPVSASASAEWAATGVDSTVVGMLDFPNGAFATIDCSMQTGVDMQEWLTVSGTEGRITLTEPFRVGEEPVQILIDRKPASQTVAVPGAYEYRLMVEHFADAVLNNRPLSYTLQDSLGNMRTIDALYRSARTGQRVEVK